MQGREVHLGNFHEDLENEETRGFEAEEEADILENIGLSLDQIKRTEDNGEVLEDIYSTLKSVQPSYENSSDMDAWNEVLKSINSEVVQALEREDMEAAEANWFDLKHELFKLKK